MAVGCFGCEVRDTLCPKDLTYFELELLPRFYLYLYGCWLRSS
jgi:hypothetical protein